MNTKPVKQPTVFVGTKARLFEEEIFMFVAASKKAAEKELRERFPKLWVEKTGGTYRSDKDGEWLIFIREEKVIG